MVASPDIRVDKEIKTMKKVLIMCYPDPQSNPRPNRMIRWLEDKYEVLVVGWNKVQFARVDSIALSNVGQGSIFRKIARRLPESAISIIRIMIRILKTPVQIVRMARGQYEDIVWAYLWRARGLKDELAKKGFDLIITHDLELMPLACSIQSDTTKIMLDAREYYPRNFDDRWLWRLLTKPVNEYLCKEYLHRCDKIITVSNGLAEEYAREYHVQPEVIMSLPAFRDLAPIPTNGKTIRIIHHGNVNISRRTELMIEMMDYVDERFSLDLMLLVGKGGYWNKIVSMVSRRKNVRIIPPVPMDQIVTFTNQYDIGLYLLQPTNFNIEYCLPNKFFEFIQARLAVAIGPSVEMKKIVEKYGCGIVSKDFAPQSLAQELNSLTAERIMQLKEQSHRAALELNAEANGHRVKEIVRELLDEQ